jgi:hypothetical protein
MATCFGRSGITTVERVKTLLGQGAGINAKDEDGTTPLIGAALHSEPRLVKILLEKRRRRMAVPCRWPHESPGSQNRRPSADGSGPILRRLRGPVSLAAGGAVYERLTKFAPVLLMQLYFVFLRSGFDAFPGGVAFRVGYALHLLEAGDCVAHVSSVMDGFFAFLGESEVFIGDMIAASFSDLGHASG